MSNLNNIDKNVRNLENGKDGKDGKDTYTKVPEFGDNRTQYVENVKKEMLFFNFGLPSNPKYVNLDWEHVIPKIKALHELWVRLNVYLANGEKQSGIIKYPEANRIIDYSFDSNNVDKSYVRFYSTRNDCNIKT